MENNKKLSREELIDKINKGKREKRNRRLRSFMLVIVIVIILGLFATFVNNYEQTMKSEPNPLNISQDVMRCLALNYKWYGSEYCTHCTTQKKYYGTDIVDFSYVSCDDNPTLCQKLNLEGYPTHIAFDQYTGNMTVLLGEVSIDDVLSATSCNVIIMNSSIEE